MGWCMGSELAEEVWDIVRPFLPEEERQQVARQIIGLFEYYDADTLGEAITLVNDSGLPEYLEDEE